MYEVKKDTYINPALIQSVNIGVARKNPGLHVVYITMMGNDRSIVTDPVDLAGAQELVKDILAAQVAFTNR